MMLSPHFGLEELQRCSHRRMDNSAPGPVIQNLQNLCANVLEPLRSQFGPLVITSGYRSREWNMLIGGSIDSAHIYGCGADIVPVFNGTTIRDMVIWLISSDIEYDQIIDEATSTSAWLHVGILRPAHETKPRRQALIMRNGEYSSFT